MSEVGGGEIIQRRMAFKQAEYERIRPHFLTESTFATEVFEELARARSKFGPVASLHEGYAVILEELDEFWDEVRGQYSDERLRRAYRELVQVAAMAQRTAEDVIARLEEPDR